MPAEIVAKIKSNCKIICPHCKAYTAPSLPLIVIPTVTQKDDVVRLAATFSLVSYFPPEPKEANPNQERQLVLAWLVAPGRLGEGSSGWSHMGVGKT